MFALAFSPIREKCCAVFRFSICGPVQELWLLLWDDLWKIAIFGISEFFFDLGPLLRNQATDFHEWPLVRYSIQRGFTTDSLCPKTSSAEFWRAFKHSEPQFRNSGILHKIMHHIPKRLKANRKFLQQKEQLMAVRTVPVAPKFWLPHLVRISSEDHPTKICINLVYRHFTTVRQNFAVKTTS